MVDIIMDILDKKYEFLFYEILEILNIILFKSKFKQYPETIFSCI